MLYRILPCLCALALLLPACGGKTDTPPAAAPQSPKESAAPQNEAPLPPPAPVPVAGVMDIGDVESYLHFSIVPTPESASDQVKINIMENKVSGVNMVTVDIRPPYPKELWLDCKVRASRGFKSQPIVLQGTIFRDEDFIGDIKGILGVDQIVNITATATSRLDAFFGLSKMEGSILIHGEVDALLMPAGTNADTLDVNNVQVTPEAQTILLSNPLRINFLKE